MKLVMARRQIRGPVNKAGHNKAEWAGLFPDRTRPLAHIASGASRGQPASHRSSNLVTQAGRIRTSMRREQIQQLQAGASVQCWVRSRNDFAALPGGPILLQKSAGGRLGAIIAASSRIAIIPIRPEVPVRAASAAAAAAHHGAATCRWTTNRPAGEPAPR
jgi:hypothetical protein